MNPMISFKPHHIGIACKQRVLCNICLHATFLMKGWTPPPAAVFFFFILPSTRATLLQLRLIPKAGASPKPPLLESTHPLFAILVLLHCARLSAVTRRDKFFAHPSCDAMKFLT